MRPSGSDGVSGTCGIDAFLQFDGLIVHQVVEVVRALIGAVAGFSGRLICSFAGFLRLERAGFGVGLVEFPSDFCVGRVAV